MITSRSFRIGASAALVVVAAACSSDSTGPSTPAASLDQVFAEASLSSLAAAAAGISPVSVSTFAMPVPSTCSYSAGTFVCPTVTIGELSFSRKFTLYDDNGAVQSQFVSGVTSRVAFDSRAHGTVTTGTTAFTVDQTHSIVLSGLTTSTHLLNGTSTTTITDVVPEGSTTTPSTTTVSATFNNLELPKGSSAYPGSGSIDFAFTSARIADVPIHMQLAFNGTSNVAVTLDISPLPPQHCTLDLSKTNPVCE